MPVRGRCRRHARKRSTASSCEARSRSTAGIRCATVLPWRVIAIDSPYSTTRSKLSEARLGLGCRYFTHAPLPKGPVTLSGQNTTSVGARIDRRARPGRSVPGRLAAPRACGSTPGGGSRREPPAHLGGELEADLVVRGDRRVIAVEVKLKAVTAERLPGDPHRVLRDQGVGREQGHAVLYRLAHEHPVERVLVQRGQAGQLQHAGFVDRQAPKAVALPPVPAGTAPAIEEEGVARPGA